MTTQSFSTTGKPEHYRGYLIQAVRKEDGWLAKFLPLKHLKRGYTPLSQQLYPTRSQARLAARKALLWHDASQQIKGWLHENLEHGNISPQEYRKVRGALQRNRHL